MPRLLIAALGVATLGLAIGAAAVLSTRPSNVDAGPNDDPFQGGATSSTEAQQREEFRMMVRSEAAQLHYWLSVLANPDSPCASPCERVTDPVETWTGLARRCEKLEPESFLAIARDASSEEEQLASAITGACRSIGVALGTGETPTDSDAWRHNASVADAALTAVAPLFQSTTGGTP